MLQPESASELIEASLRPPLPPSAVPLLGLYVPPLGVVRRTAPDRRKVLILDLDETLIHSSVYDFGAPPQPYDLRLEVRAGPATIGRAGGRAWRRAPMRGDTGRAARMIAQVFVDQNHAIFHVRKRPYMDFFLSTVAKWYELAVFTASMQDYGDAVIEWIDAGRGFLRRRYFRDSCQFDKHGNYVKDITKVEPDLTSVLIIDNLPMCYFMQPGTSALHRRPAELLSRMRRAGCAVLTRPAARCRTAPGRRLTQIMRSRSVHGSAIRMTRRCWTCCRCCTASVAWRTCDRYWHYVRAVRTGKPCKVCGTVRFSALRRAACTTTPRPCGNRRRTRGPWMGATTHTAGKATLTHTRTEPGWHA